MSESNNNTKPVEVYQVVIAFLVLLSIVIGSAVNISSRITALEIKQQANDLFIIEMRSYFATLQDGQTKILISLEGKANRDNK